MREPKWQSPLARGPLERGHGTHLQDEVGGGQPELWWPPIEDQDEHDSLLAAALLVVGEAEVEAGAGAAQYAEAVPCELFVVEGNVEVEVPASHARHATGKLLSCTRILRRPF